MPPIAGPDDVPTEWCRTDPRSDVLECQMAGKEPKEKAQVVLASGDQP